MHPLRLTAEYASSLGVSLTEKAHRALANAVGLAGSFDACDEAFVSIALRHSNTVLAHFVDRFRLDFSKTDDEIVHHADAKDEDVIRDELRRIGFKNEPFDDILERARRRCITINAMTSNKDA